MIFGKFFHYDSNKLRVLAISCSPQKTITFYKEITLPTKPNTLYKFRFLRRALAPVWWSSSLQENAWLPSFTQTKSSRRYCNSSTKWSCVIFYWEAGTICFVIQIICTISEGNSCLQTIAQQCCNNQNKIFFLQKPVFRSNSTQAQLPDLESEPSELLFQHLMICTFFAMHPPVSTVQKLQEAWKVGYEH